MTDGPATRGDLFDAMAALMERLEQLPRGRPSPFVGCKLFVWNSHTTVVAVYGPAECLDHSGSHLLVRNPAGKEAWINLNVIPSVSFLTDEEWAKACRKPAPIAS